VKREKIRKLTAEGCPDCRNYVIMFGWDSFAIKRAKKNLDLLGKTLFDIAEEQKRKKVQKSLLWTTSHPVDPFDVAADFKDSPLMLYLLSESRNIPYRKAP